MPRCCPAFLFCNLIRKTICQVCFSSLVVGTAFPGIPGPYFRVTHPWSLGGFSFHLFHLSFCLSFRSTLWQGFRLSFRLSFCLSCPLSFALCFRLCWWLGSLFFSFCFFDILSWSATGFSDRRLCLAWLLKKSRHTLWSMFCLSYSACNGQEAMTCNGQILNSANQPILGIPQNQVTDSSTNAFPGT